MKKTLALVIIIYSHVSFLHACTTFFINKNGQMVFGRNYDWVTDAGMVCTNLKGLSKTSMQTKTAKRSAGYQNTEALLLINMEKNFQQVA